MPPSPQVIVLYSLKLYVPAIPNEPTLLPLYDRPERLGAVLDERDAVLVGDGLELLDPGHAAEHVDDEDRRRPRA